MNTTTKKNKLTHEIGDIFARYEATKKRPVLIINDGLGVDLDVLTTRITSTKPRNEYDVALKYWEEAGLKQPSTVRVNKNKPIFKDLLKVKIGSLHPEDLERVFTKLLEYHNKGYERVKEKIEKAKEIEKAVSRKRIGVKIEEGYDEKI